MELLHDTGMMIPRGARVFNPALFAPGLTGWCASALALVGLVLVMSLAVMIAWNAAAVHPRGALRADVLKCLHVDTAPTVIGANLTDRTSLSVIRLREERVPHSSWERRVELPPGRTLAPPWQLSWVADSMTDTVRVTASDGFVGATLRFAASSRLPWWGRVEAFTDVAGNERDLGRIRVDTIPCAVALRTPAGKPETKARGSSHR
jgi:hypothetical protein